MPREDGEFKKGQSGNPSGRSKAFREVQEAAQAYGKECIARLWGLAENAADERVKVMAMKEILDRAVGKAPQAITGEDGGPLRVDTGETVAEIIRKLVGGREPT